MKKLALFAFVAALLVACGTAKEGGDSSKKEAPKPTKVDQKSNNKSVSGAENL